ncbi:hypothetical protein M404DRAFT_35306 [Pisolithus tinctorius Marx 270]|uniref:Uncharacterized protein n=1 Tax=Pisolithus tinctorius Marx 270 TaxID=870435 RepID=A0A0C3IAQ0_PISTI|nr:hypothetical protein M404DRAFT_35306 [Pisolithus tinctorius Marx 270]
MATVKRPANASNDWQMALTDSVCEYMVARLCEEIVDGPCALPPITIPLQIACEADHILAIIIQAYRECVTADIKQDVKIDTAHSNYTEITYPTVLIDKEGGILLWYLPNAISQAYQSEVWNSLGMLSIPLQCSLKSNGTGRWQHDVKNFHDAANLKGTIDLSPTWFQQGHGSPAKQPNASSRSITSPKVKIMFEGGGNRMTQIEGCGTAGPGYGGGLANVELGLQFHVCDGELRFTPT